MLYYLHHLEHFFGPLRLFRYVTFRGSMALMTALLWGIFIGPKIFAILRRAKIKDVVRDASIIKDLAVLHEQKKQIPTMGGLAILSGVCVSCLLWLKPNLYGYCVLLTGLFLGLVGAIDDGLKLKQQNTRGLSGRRKLAAQALATVFVLWVLLHTTGIEEHVRQLYVPFLKNPLWTNMPFIALALFWFLVIAGTSNALNLTDGLDGLAVGCTLPVLLTYTVFAYVTGHIHLARYLNLPYLNGVEELSILCLAIVGACIAFLWFNAYPATIIMGDTGSLAIGGWIGCIALMTHQAFTLVLVGLVFVIEALSVILQVFSYKTFHKRCFKMSPIHHHFELSGIAEPKIVIRFWIVSLLCALLGLMTLKLR